jgi:signal transduction histidine kinase
MAPNDSNSDFTDAQTSDSTFPISWESSVQASIPHGETDELQRQLYASEERYQLLFLQEQRRARHLSLINEVQKCALASREISQFLAHVVRSIGVHFRGCDVTIYLSRAALNGLNFMGIEAEGVLEMGNIWHGDIANELIVVATFGDNQLGESLNTKHSIQHITDGDLFHPETKSSLSVPIVINNEHGGLVIIQSREEEAIDARDDGALGTASAIIASYVQNARLFASMRETAEFNKQLLNSMLHSLLVVDAQGRIQFVNERLLQTFGRNRDDILYEPLETIIGERPANHHQLRKEIATLLENGQSCEIPEVHVWARESAQIFDVRLFRVYFRGEAEAALLLINLTQRWRKTYQLQLMHEIGRLFQESLEIDRVISSVLTCITAGSALGFNRAFVFLCDDIGGRLEGRNALGPSSAEEASRIWGEISQHELTLSELLRSAEELRGDPTPLQKHTRSLRIDPANPYFAKLKTTLEAKTAVRVQKDELIAFTAYSAGVLPEEQLAEARRLSDLFSAPEIAIAPLVAKEKLVGVVFADNLYSSAPIEDDDIQLLDTLAQQAGLTIDNALTYEALQEAQRELVSSERLVAVGEMAARVSHEIRNPLATIGGFARSVLKKPNDIESVRRKTQVVVDEVARLEELLTDLLDMARPRPLDLKEQNVNDLVEHALLLAEADIRALGAHVEREFTPDLPLVSLDRSRMLQALLNTIRNGAQAMPNGGELRVGTRLITGNEIRPEMVEISVADSGVGISEKALRQVFDPFFSTKVSGSGLGLAVTKRIIQDHGGHIDVHSSEGKGTTFIFSLLVHRQESENEGDEMY